MSIEAFERHLEITKKVMAWEKRHPYRFSFIASLVIVSFMLFFSPPLEVSEEDLMPTDNIQFLDIDRIQAQTARRVTRPELSTTSGETDPTNSDVERAQGTSDDPNAVDLAFQPNVVPPRLIGRLKKEYPLVAREKAIEATVRVQLLISSSGRVKSVLPLNITLSRQMPPEIQANISKAFARTAIKMLKEIRYSPPIVNGKNVPVKYETTLRFRLEDM
jgi:outer membrane biosynthesis protein TonB